MQPLWPNLIRWEAAKVAPWMAARNTLGVALPLGVGALLGMTNSGLVAATGALNVSFSDGRDPYIQRAERMVASSVFCAMAVMVGALSGGHDGLAVLVTFGWAFTAGMLVALDQAAADIGTISLVSLVVFGAHQLSPQDSLYSGLLACSGGLLQTGLAVALWAARRYEPEREDLAALYAELARAAASPMSATEAPPATAQMSQAQRSLAAITGSRSVQADRYLLLLSQAERIRLSLLFLSRLRVRLQRDPEAQQFSTALDEYFGAATQILSSVAQCLTSGTAAPPHPQHAATLQQVGSVFRKIPKNLPPTTYATVSDTMHQLEALSGQLRSAMELADHTTTSGLRSFERKEARQPWRLRVLGTLPVLRANLTLDSAACRHAVRLAVCVALADSIARASGWGRSYWLPMTAAIVLKPDFTATLSRGVLRLAGTFAGLALATGFFHVLPVSFPSEFTGIVIFTFLLRCYGPANYGVLVTAVSALVVALVAVSGTTPSEAIAARALNTVVGGVLALIAYAVWPTWERTQLRDVLSRMLDAYRDYFYAIRRSYLHPDEAMTPEMDRTRQEGRLARSNFEASVERFASEPGCSREAMAEWSSMLASSHRLIHAMMALEAGLSRSSPAPARPAFGTFSHDVEVTLHSLALALRGSVLTGADLPNLREDHHALMESGDSLTERYAMVNIETDRITNSLNTLAGQILHLLSPTDSPKPAERKITGRF